MDLFVVRLLWQDGKMCSLTTESCRLAWTTSPLAAGCCSCDRWLLLLQLLRRLLLLRRLMLLLQLLVLRRRRLRRCRASFSSSRATLDGADVSNPSPPTRPGALIWQIGRCGISTRQVLPHGYAAPSYLPSERARAGWRASGCFSASPCGLLGFPLPRAPTCGGLAVRASGHRLLPGRPFVGSTKPCNEEFHGVVELKSSGEHPERGERSLRGAGWESIQRFGTPPIFTGGC